MFYANHLSYMREIIVVNVKEPLEANSYLVTTSVDNLMFTLTEKGLSEGLNIGDIHWLRNRWLSDARNYKILTNGLNYIILLTRFLSWTPFAYNIFVSGWFDNILFKVSGKPIIDVTKIIKRPYASKSYEIGKDKQAELEKRSDGVFLT